MELLERMRIDSVTLLDVGPPGGFAAGHLPCAVNITLAELEDRQTDVPFDREVVAYCRGRYRMLSVDAVRVLQKQGYRARRLQEGLPEWRAAGLPVMQSGP
ncbi:rhodanese-like domain-containing protein [Devosia salina]|uniref:Rhodanese-like domain-containing protein n=1 Tax=Devosia salina TaxID=2860336 RepID=A0ABX8WA41_9HYPH|nr:rhodanese-like domain-containing protein [Devosia salina]